MSAASLDPRARAQTAGYFGGHVVIGLVSASLGPTLPAIAAQIAEQPEALGMLFSARGLGYLLGSLSCGRLYDRRPAHPLLVLAIAVLATSMVMVPLLPNRSSLLAIMLVIGGAQGLLDVGNNTSLMRVHGRKVAPYMNALHCFYGVGAMLCPVVVDAAGSMSWAYATLALAMLPTAGWLLMISSPSLPAPTPAPVTAAGGEIGRAGIVGAFVLLFMFCQGAEAGFGGWCYVIATQAGFTDGAAARLLSSFWAVFTAWRVLSIVLATRIRPKRILLASLVGSLVSVGVLLVVPGPIGLWVGTLGLGLSLASVFPTALAFAGEYVQLSGALTSRLFVGASVGTMVMPWVIGASFGLGRHAPMLVVLLDLVVALGVLVAIVRRGATRDASALARFG